METDFSADWLITRITEYFDRGFGSFTKNDFEVLIFQSLLENDKDIKSNYYYSQLLRIPLTKVKRLRYEADLKYGKILTSQSEYRENKLKQFNNLIKAAKFKVTDKNKIQFSIEDLSLRRFLEELLKKDGSFADSSFNSEIVTISIDDLLILLNQSEEGEKIVNEIKNKALIAFNKFDNSDKLKFDDYWPKILIESLSLAKEGIKTTKTIIDAISGKTLVESVLDKIPEVMINIFKKIKQIK